MTDNPIFGGNWTDDKLMRLEKYLRAYRQIFEKNQYAIRYRTIYVDAFAGSGKRINPATSPAPPLVEFFDATDAADAQLFQQGSVEVALSLKSPFDAYLFIEHNPLYAQELEQFIAQQFPILHPCTTIVTGDANIKLQHWCNTTDWKRHRAVVFLDPYGMQVEWKTLEAIAATQAIDMWLLFPLGQAINRLLTRQTIPSGRWSERLTALFGTDEWQAVFYATSPQLSMFDEPQLVKTATFQSIQRFFVKRLESIFPKVAEPRPLLNSRNVPLYLLCFAASNARVAPTAVKIAQHILQS
jgi:three-Cys-motif partner protein